MAKQDVTKIDGITQDEIDNLSYLQEAQAALQESETAEEKTLKQLIDITPDAATKKVLSDRLKTIHSQKTTSDKDALELVRESQYTLAYVLRMGFSKIENQESYQIKARAKKESEKKDEKTK